MIESGSYFNLLTLRTGKRNDKVALTMSCFFHQLQTTVCEAPVTEEMELQDLTTINMEALSRLNEEVLIEIGSSVLQVAPSTATPVWEELIGTCVMPTKIKAVQRTLGKESE